MPFCWENNNQDLRWRITPYLTGDKIDSILADVRTLLECIHAGHDVKWNRQNLVGVLTDDAEAASDNLRQYLEQVDPDLKVLDMDWYLYHRADVSNAELRERLATEFAGDADALADAIREEAWDDSDTDYYGNEMRIMLEGDGDCLSACLELEDDDGPRP